MRNTIVVYKLDYIKVDIDNVLYFQIIARLLKVNRAHLKLHC